MGKFGKKATPEQIAKNCKKAIEFGKWLRKTFPSVEFYIPAEHENFVTPCYRKGYLTIKQILEIDCEIISKCDGMLIYAPDDFISNGMKVEWNSAKDKIAIRYFGSTDVGYNPKKSVELLIQDIKERN